MKIFKCDRVTEGCRKMEKFVGKKSRILSQIINKLTLFELNLICIFQYNNTYYGISAVHTGQVKISKLEQYTMWRGQS